MQYSERAEWEPVAAFLREQGLNAAAADVGVTPGVMIDIDRGAVGTMFVIADNGRTAYHLTDRDGFSAGGDILIGASPSSSPKQMAAVIASVAADLVAGRNLSAAGYRG